MERGGGEGTGRRGSHLPLPLSHRPSEEKQERPLVAGPHPETFSLIQVHSFDIRALAMTYGTLSFFLSSLALI